MSPFPASPLEPELLDGGPLPEAVLGDRQHLPGTGHDKGDDPLPVSPICMPRTPRDERPMARTSCSRNRIALPPLEMSMISRSPSVSTTPARESPSSRCTAMMPALRGRENAESAVFLTIPPRVAMKT